MKTKVATKPYFFKVPKTYSAEEIIAAEGTTAFDRLTGYNSQHLYELKGEGLSNEEIKQAIGMLTK